MLVKGFDLASETDLNAYLNGRESDISKCICKNVQYNYVIYKVTNKYRSPIDDEEVTIGSFMFRSLKEFKKEQSNALLKSGLENLPDLDRLDLLNGFLKPSWTLIEPKLLECSVLNLFCHHIWHNICAENDDYHHQFMGFLAHIFQKPDERPAYAFLIIGPEGSGKGILNLVLHECLLSYYAHCVGIKDFLKMNKQIDVCKNLLIIIDEVSKVSNDEYQQFKSLITERNINASVYSRGSVITVPIYYRIIMFSNAINPISMNDSERRYVVLNAQLETKEYYNRLMDQIKQNKKQFINAFISMMTTYNINDFEPHDPIRTESQKDLIVINRNEPNIHYFLSHHSALMNGQEVISTEIYEAYLMFCRQNNLTEKRNASQLGSAFRMFCFSREIKIKGQKKVLFRLQPGFLEQLSK